MNIFFDLLIAVAVSSSDRVNESRGEKCRGVRGRYLGSHDAGPALLSCPIASYPISSWPTLFQSPMFYNRTVCYAIQP